MTSRRDDTVHADTMDAGAEPSRAGAGELAPGEVVGGRYRVEVLLGRGGMGAVYRVHDGKIDEPVCLKLITLEGERAAELLSREVRLARRVTHRNVARTHDLGEHRGAHFLTMEYVRGTSLERPLAAEGRFAPERAVAIGAQIAAGLGAAHAAGVIHRDLKPANVLLGDDGRVVLTDFGIARAVHGGASARDTGIVGTPHYMAPEQIAGRATDARSDVYALGLLVYEMATGRLPFRGDDPMTVAAARLQEPPEDPRSFAPVSDDLAELLLNCLAREPAARPASAGDVLAALADLRGGDRESARTGGRSYEPFAPLSPGNRALALLPFQVRGAAEHEYLGDSVAEELIDLLSRTRGLRVLSLGATRRFAGDRDPVRIGRELATEAVVDGTVQVAGERVRIAARLVDTDSGLQLWSERYDGAFTDVFALQESMGRRIAEALRLELDAAAHRSTAPQEAIELFLRARRLVRSDLSVGTEEAVTMLERCLELAPGFTPALPVHAMASVRAWWGAADRAASGSHERACRAVDRACGDAPGIAETHLARAMLDVQGGEFRSAARALARALEIAPTLPEAHHYLGALQLEAGRRGEARRRLQLALELDPTLHMVHFALARLAALDGDFDTVAAELRVLGEAVPVANLPVAIVELRYALWLGKTDHLGALVSRLRGLDGEAPARLSGLLGVLVGEADIEEAREALATYPASLGNARLTSLIRQVAVEVFASVGARDAALDLLAEVAAGPLIDVSWMRGCPLVRGLADSPVYESALAQVEERAAAVWR